MRKIKTIQPRPNITRKYEINNQLWRPGHALKRKYSPWLITVTVWMADKELKSSCMSKYVTLVMPSVAFWTMSFTKDPSGLCSYKKWLSRRPIYQARPCCNPGSGPVICVIPLFSPHFPFCQKLLSKIKEKKKVTTAQNACWQSTDSGWKSFGLMRQNWSFLTSHISSMFKDGKL